MNLIKEINRSVQMVDYSGIMKFRYSSIYVFCAFICILGCISLINYLTDTEKETMERKMLIDSISNGGFGEKFEKEFSDHFMGREEFLALSEDIKLMKGIKNDEVQLIAYQGANVNQASSESIEKIKASESMIEELERPAVKVSSLFEDSESVASEPEEMVAEPEGVIEEPEEMVEELESVVEESEGVVEESEGVTDEPENKIEESEWGTLLIYNGAAIEINYFNEVAAQNYANAINAFADKFEDLEIYSLLVPTQIEFVDDEQYQSLSVPEEQTIERTNDLFSERVKTIDVLGFMKVHSDEYLFFRTDHHWTQRGAYYAFVKYAEVIGEEAPQLDDYEYEITEGFLGGLYRVTLNKQIARTPDDVETFSPLTAHTLTGLIDRIGYNEGNVLVKRWLALDEKYGVFIGGDQPIVGIDTENKNGRRILVLKDSYANAFVPFLVDVAEKIIVVDPRLFEGNIQNVITEQEITEIFFLNYALITRWDGFGDLYNQLLNKE